MSLFQGELLVALFTLSTLEIVLGVDNLVFISIAVGRLPEARRSLARKLGLSFACLTRIALLVVLAHLARMDDTHSPLFQIGGQVISVRDLIMTGGGVFLLVKGAMEIHETIYGAAKPPSAGAAMSTFVWEIVQIALIGIVFSLAAATLLGGRIDLAVHSAKDMPTFSQPGLTLAACLEREDPRDVFISRKAKSLSELPVGATLGTASLRRQAIAKRARGDLRVVPLRGNVETRLRKLESGEVDATLLALAGMKRLGLTQHATRIMSADEFLPAVGQGAIGIEARENDTRAREALARVNHDDTFAAVSAERAFLAVLDGSCKTPISGHATFNGDSISFRGLIARPDGGAAHDIAVTGHRADAINICSEAGRELKRLAGPGFFD